MKSVKFAVKNKQHSKEIQKRLFKLGIIWGDIGANFQHLDKPALYVWDDDRVMFSSRDDYDLRHFTESSETEYILLDGEFVPAGSVALSNGIPDSDAVMAWSIEDALVLIRNIQPKCMELGYYIALAGGVLNKGYSDSDLDLVAIPRTKTSASVQLTDYLRNILEFSDFAGHVASAEIYAYTLNGKRIEIAIVGDMCNV
jgi:hypothetical protein